MFSLLHIFRVALVGGLMVERANIVSFCEFMLAATRDRLERLAVQSTILCD